MNDVIGSDPPQGPEHLPTLEEFLRGLDVSGWSRRLKLVLVVAASVLLLVGLNWLRAFYTDWLWFSNQGYEQILLKTVTTKIWLFWVGGFLFAAIAGTNLHLVFRTTRGLAPLAPHRYPSRSVRGSESPLNLAFCWECSGDEPVCCHHSGPAVGHHSSFPLGSTF